jgi:hypothetical protein
MMINRGEGMSSRENENNTNFTYYIQGPGSMTKSVQKEEQLELGNSRLLENGDYSFTTLRRGKDAHI